MEFSIKEIIILLKKRVLFIGVCTLLGLSALFIISKCIIKPTYTASVQMYIDPNDKNSAADLTELNYAQKVVTTYISFLETKVFYKQVLEECKLDYTQNELKSMTTIEIVNNTEIFQISIKSYSANDSFKIMSAMQKIAPQLIKSIKDTAEISVVDPVVYSTTPSSPNTVFNTMLGGIAGFIFSILVSFIWEILDVKIKNDDDLMKKYNLPILGQIPNYSTLSRKQSILIKLKSVIGRNKKMKRIDRSIDDNTKFVITEAYKSLRTNLRFTLHANDCKKFIISSPVPEEGKSTVSANIGITIAQTGSKVLLMDCDLRKGRLHKFFNLKSRPGISDVLSGMVEVNDVIMETSYQNLYVLTMGSIAPNPTELLASSSMENLIKKLEKEYDYIIIDTPPINIVSDSLSLVRLVDGVVIVARERISSHPNIVSAIDKFRFAEANLLGFVINGVIINRDKKSKSQYYYYHGGDNND